MRVWPAIEPCTRSAVTTTATADVGGETCGRLPNKRAARPESISSGTVMPGSASAGARLQHAVEQGAPMPSVLTPLRRRGLAAAAAAVSLGLLVAGCGS